ncbi:MAG: hypothetical protein ACTHJ4_02345 [Candidatus Nucleicultricaceae bacterium]
MYTFKEITKRIALIFLLTSSTLLIQGCGDENPVTTSGDFQGRPVTGNPSDTTSGESSSSSP